MCCRFSRSSCRAFHVIHCIAKHCNREHSHLLVERGQLAVSECWADPLFCWRVGTRCSTTISTALVKHNSVVHYISGPFICWRRTKHNEKDRARVYIFCVLGIIFFPFCGRFPVSCFVNQQWTRITSSGTKRHNGSRYRDYNATHIVTREFNLRQHWV